MKLDQIALVLLAIAAFSYLGVMVFGLIQIWPYGLIGLAFIAVVLAIVGRIVYERLNNKEDNYYEKNVDK